MKFNNLLSYTSNSATLLLNVIGRQSFLNLINNTNIYNNLLNKIIPYLTELDTNLDDKIHQLECNKSKNYYENKPASIAAATSDDRYKHWLVADKKLEALNLFAY